ncbi:hypothetical protein A7U60_g8282 [Sanghuangporus baumii]|uniref:Uncharacterized protein n=1 Tax=Sanghuangporus baumii TaxID=108892 RepID=A0A9Q5HS13_SANBA|nr:hypothetical protein A7U60_g8282 [Sanghuangporus baumii]
MPDDYSRLMGSKRANDTEETIMESVVKTGDVKDITESIEVHRSPRVLRPEGHPRHSYLLNKFGHPLFSRFQHSGAIGDLTESIELRRSTLTRSDIIEDFEESIKLYRSALSLPLNGNPDRKGGNIEDITESIKFIVFALTLRQEGHSHRSQSLSNLAYSLRLRFERSGSVEDITETVDLYRSALALT